MSKMMIFRFRYVVFILISIIATALVIQGCNPVTQATEKSSETDPVVKQSDVASEPDEVIEQNVLKVAMQPIVQVDPAQISSDSEVLVASHIYDYLVDVDPSSRIIPRLAETWQVSEDGLIYTFTLVDGVKFHDGSPFGAGDVAWTFNRLRDPNSGYPTADLYANLENISVVNDSEVIFTLKQPNPFFLYDLSDNHALILKEGTTDTTEFNGTGPFKVSSYRPEDRIVLESNPDYWIAGQPAVSSIEVIFFNDDTAMVDALRGGQIDLVLRLPVSLYESLQTEEDITTISIPSNKFDVIRLRADRAPGNDPRVIQAFKMATDRNVLLRLVQQGSGAVGRDSPIGPLYADYYSEDTPIPARDVEGAKKLLEAAGYADGLDIELHTPDTENRPDLAAALKSQWSEAGINVEIIVEPESVYYGDDGWLEVDLGITGWGSRPYPQFYFDVMLVCDAKWNESHYCNPEVDRLVKLAGSTLDEEERIKAYQEIQKILIENGPIIVPYFSATNAALRDRFEGFSLKAFAGRTDLRGVYLVK